MPFALVIIGLILVVTSAKGTISALGAQLLKDFTGKNNFTYWLVAIGAVGSLGYVPSLSKFTRYFMSLILIVMVLSNRGFFAQFMAAIKSGPTKPTIAKTATSTVVTSSTSGNSTTVSTGAPTPTAQSTGNACTGSVPGELCLNVPVGSNNNFAASPGDVVQSLTDAGSLLASWGL